MFGEALRAHRWPLSAVEANVLVHLGDVHHIRLGALAAALPHDADAGRPHAEIVVAEPDRGLG